MSELKQKLEPLEERRIDLRKRLEEGSYEGRYDAVADRYWGSESRANYSNRMSGYVTEIESIDKQVNALKSEIEALESTLGPIQTEYTQKTAELRELTPLLTDAKNIYEKLEHLR